LGVGDRLDRMSLNSVHQIVVLPYCLRLWLWKWAWTFMFYIKAKTLVSMLTASWTHIMPKDLLNLILEECVIFVSCHPVTLSMQRLVRCQASFHQSHGYSLTKQKIWTDRYSVQTSLLLIHFVLKDSQIVD
jgi:hypothetical protein